MEERAWGGVWSYSGYRITPGGAAACSGVQEANLSDSLSHPQGWSLLLQVTQTTPQGMSRDTFFSISCDRHSGIAGCSCPWRPGSQQKKKKKQPCPAGLQGRDLSCAGRGLALWHWKMRPDPFLYCCCRGCDLQENLNLAVVCSLLPVHLIWDYSFGYHLQHFLCAKAPAPSAGARFRVF